MIAVKWVSILSALPAMAGLFSVAAAPAFASSNAEWECANGFRASAGKGMLTLSKTMGSEYGYKGGYPPRGSSRFTWNLRGGDLWVNGKKCKVTN